MDGVCRICGERFLNEKQLSWLQERIDGRRSLSHVVGICPGCRQKGHGLVK